MVTNTTRKVRTKTSKTLVGRRGQSATKTVHVEVEAKDAPLKKKIISAIIDIAFIILFSEIMFFRKAYHVFVGDGSLMVGKFIIYLLAFLLIYIGCLRLFGQSLGMKILKIKVLMKSDYSFVPVSTLLQRQTIGPILNLTVGLINLITQKQFIADTIFKTMVIEIEKP